MLLHTLIKITYVLLGLVYLLIGAGAVLLPAGWVPAYWLKVLGIAYATEAQTSFFNHLTQEFGTVVIALGMLFLWQARRTAPSRKFHWIMTLYLVLDALIHWIGPEGFIGDIQSGLINSIPPLLMLALGLLRLRHGSESRSHKSRQET